MKNDNLCEKVSVNINSSTLSSIDILVDNGYYSNRSDFINQAIRESIKDKQGIIDRIIDEKVSKSEGTSYRWFFGVSGVTAEEIRNDKMAGKKVNISGYGVFIIPEDIEAQLIYDVYEQIDIKGKVVCSAEIKKHYAIRK